MRKNDFVYASSDSGSVVGTITKIAGNKITVKDHDGNQHTFDVTRHEVFMVCPDCHMPHCECDEQGYR